MGKIAQAGIRLFATIMFLGIASSTGGTIWWVLFFANLALFLYWAGAALSEEEKGSIQ